MFVDCRTSPNGLRIPRSTLRFKDLAPLVMRRSLSGAAQLLRGDSPPPSNDRYMCCDPSKKIYIATPSFISIS